MSTTPPKKRDLRTVVTEDRRDILHYAREKSLETRRRKKALKESKQSRDFLIHLRNLIDTHIKQLPNPAPADAPAIVHKEDAKQSSESCMSA